MPLVPPVVGLGIEIIGQELQLEQHVEFSVDLETVVLNAPLEVSQALQVLEPGA